MPAREERAERSRAALLVSLILLVIHSAVTGFSLLSPAATTTPVLPVSRTGDRAAGAPVPIGPPTGAHAPEMTARQAFLIGKRLDVNRATWREISALPGISDSVARRVVETRERVGGYRSAEGLLAVPGIKEKRLRKILPFLANFDNK